ncbi:DUF2894 domain-containing protein [Pandoraea nosoerga]|uniref:DUF2894 domain-containing protein n=1 Tax=Pandoraea nosoerga TaxID=2508296 RepID=A0A5E4T4F4_9BURK|nr:DUF2894 domain-containing protein [Pandoraea nosoerga]MBN4664267.1 DUF2894 domain-containing protein [Pandoraea nosoerga]MBN4675838.1 DUF2894 domain-containing protein [Pandoraea nosoerga]MBN4679355.1 DUF2894 domain-containing protein [Pandoraea nosoerga]MBN4743648.1 DUF2894 domain-containing protein [Pandoraea nosoerga]VVD83046.1 hypothetical protein PNO31109_01204 [Pandoraea nosoerga]
MRDAHFDSPACDGASACEAPHANAAPDVPAAPDAVSAQLAQWRSQGADKRDPVLFHRIEALAARSRGYGGDVRRMLDERLKMLVEALARRLASAETVTQAPRETHADPSVASPLAALAAGISQRTGERAARASASRAAHAHRLAARGDREPHSARDGQAGDAPASSVAPAAARPAATAPAPVAVPITPTVISTDDAFEDLDVLEYFRETWSKLSTDGNLRQSLAQVPENAGPLNSSHLVHRALSLMHDVSPDYLRHFLRHADALSWLEDMEAAGVLGAKATARATAAVKPGRTKAR